MITNPLPEAIPAEAPKRKRHVLRWSLTGVAVLVALLAGVGIGAASGNNAGALAAAQAATASQHRHAAALQGQVSSLQSQLSTAQTKLGLAQTQAQQAVGNANAKAAAAYAARNSALSQQMTAVKQQGAAIAAEAGQLQASQISGDGVYVVGHDIKAGVYHTAGSGNTGANDCYFATLNSTDTSNIADNNNFDGPETVDVSGAYAFEINGPCTWARVS